MAPLSVPHSTLLQDGHDGGLPPLFQAVWILEGQEHCTPMLHRMLGPWRTWRKRVSRSSLEAGSAPHDVACGHAILPHFQVVGVNRHLQGCAFTSAHRRRLHTTASLPLPSCVSCPGIIASGTCSLLCTPKLCNSPDL